MHISHQIPEMSDFKGFLTVLSPPPTPSSTDKSHLAMLCYGLVVVVSAAVVLALYSLVIIKRRGRRHLQSPPNGLVEVVTASSSTENSQWSFLSSFKYKKETAGKEVGVGVGGDDDYECPVCLSAYEEGEEVRKLPRCKHCFHASCIDMWLHSHFDCPICRTPVRTFCHGFPPENSRQRVVESGGGVSV